MSMATHSGSMETLVSKLRYTEECSPQSGTLQSRTQTLGKWNIRKKSGMFFLFFVLSLILSSCNSWICGIDECTSYIFYGMYYVITFLVWFYVQVWNTFYLIMYFVRVCVLHIFYTWVWNTSCITSKCWIEIRSIWLYVWYECHLSGQEFLLH